MFPLGNPIESQKICFHLEILSISQKICFLLEILSNHKKYVSTWQIIKKHYVSNHKVNQIIKTNQKKIDLKNLLIERNKIINAYATIFKRYLKQ